MKIVFIVLLIAAIGGGVYYYSSHKQGSSLPGTKELIRGKWRIDSVALSHGVDSSSNPRQKLPRIFIDSSLSSYEFEFTKDSLVFQAPNGKIPDTGHYMIAGAKNILFWSNNDTAKTKWTISKLDTLNLVVLDSDSTRFFFKKLK